MKMAVFTDEAWRVLRFALPQMAILYCTMIVNSVTLAFIGNYDPEPSHIAGATLGNQYFQMTGQSIGIGLSIQLGAFCAQNFGRGATQENSIFFWKCVKTLAGSFVFATVAACSTVSVLGALGQPADAIKPASLYNWVQLLSLVPTWGSSALNATLASQKHLAAGVLAAMAGNIVNFGLVWWLLVVEDVGYLGVAWGNVAGQWVGFFVLVLYVMSTKMQSTVWRLPPANATTLKISLWFYIREALPSAFSLWAEWWAGCLLGIFAGLLPNPTASVAANGILFACLAVFYMTFVGVQMATQQRMGELVGSKNVDRIPSSIATAAGVTLSLAMAVCVALQVFGADILKLYTHDAEIVAEAVAALPGMVGSIAPYALMMCLLGALRSAGLQRWGTGALIVSFYVFGIPFGAYAGLSLGWGLLGVWSGNVLSLTLAAMSMSVKICTVEWSSVVEKAMAYQEPKQVSEPKVEATQSLSDPLLRAEKVEA